MIGLGIDFETTGLDVKNDRIIEAGAVLWDFKRGKALKIYNEFVYLEKEFPWNQALVKIHGIEFDDLFCHGKTIAEVLASLAELASMADFVVAHNGTMFDKPLLFAEVERASTLWAHEKFNKLWLDTSIDVPYPENITTRKLTHLAAEHGFLNPFPHRAFSDVLTMLKILQMYDVEKVVERSKIPNLLITADVSYADREKAKSQGFRWDAEAKLWKKIIKQDILEVDKANWQFEFSSQIL